MNLSLPDSRELSALLRLLDDETPEVRDIVSKRLGEFGGDLSEVISGLQVELSAADQKLLRQILMPARRKILLEEWITPGFGTLSLGEDWELFESQLRLLSDFLHDGLCLRQTLSDALDFLAEEAQEEGVNAANDLRIFLFEKKRLGPNQKSYYDSRNSDLAWCLAEGKSNPIGLGVIFMLIGQRIGLEIEGISFPGHFLCRIQEEGFPLIVDCFDNGCVHSQQVLTDPSNELGAEHRKALQGRADLGTILIRILNNLIDALQREERAEDSQLITVLRDAMLQQNH